MHKVASVNLSGNAYQIEEDGYAALAAYLAEAERQLAGNPDRAEILADLEQAIADRCRAHLSPGKTVVAAPEIAAILREMGPVDPGPGEDRTAADGDRAAGGGGARTVPGREGDRRLYRIPDGAMLGGVCTGLAAYFQIDVTIVRAIFVIVALITQGAGIVAYIALMFILPEASTPKERAAAGGAPFNAQEIVDRAKRQYADGRKRLRREWRRYHRRHGWPPGYGPPAAVAPLLPLFAIVHTALFVAAAAAAISLVNRGEILGWVPPPDVPIWAALIILFILYQVAVSPIRAVSHWSLHPDAGAGAGWFAFWHAIVWLVGVAFVIWIASNHLPDIREFLQELPEIFHDFVRAVRRLLTR